MANNPGRNDPCPCGSGKKYKKCCLDWEKTVHIDDDKVLSAGPEYMAAILSFINDKIGPDNVSSDNVSSDNVSSDNVSSDNVGPRSSLGRSVPVTW